MDNKFMKICSPSLTIREMQNYIEIVHHCSQNGHHQENKEQQMPERTMGLLLTAAGM
jgi:hypothetical protein